MDFIRSGRGKFEKAVLGNEKVVVGRGHENSRIAQDVASLGLPHIQRGRAVSISARRLL